MKEESATDIDQRLEAAARWHLRLAAAGDDEILRAEFRQWLSSHPDNVAAFEQILQGVAQVEVFAAEREIIALRRRALDRAQRGSDMGRSKRRSRWLGVAAGVCCVAIAASVFFALLRPATQEFTTGADERRILTLDDGSRLSMDANTKVTVNYSKSKRHLELSQGQARFMVAHDAVRPFTVIARERTVLATGTVFNIDMLPQTLLVTLIEGRVRIDATGMPATSVELRPAEQLRVDAYGTRVRANVDTVDVEAWEQGKLVFDDEPLSEAIERVNRYAQTKVVFTDPALKRMTVSGVFNAGDVRAFVEGVTAAMPLRSSERPDGYLLQLAP